MKFFSLLLILSQLSLSSAYFPQHFKETSDEANTTQERDLKGRKGKGGKGKAAKERYVE